jgi:ATP-dependent helicase Lhr and Lhr-like helicase
VRGLSGIQFALPTAVERLRRPPSPEVRLVAASDPANAFGPVLPVAAEQPYRVIRVPGNWLVLEGGVPLLAVEGRGRRLVPLSARDLGPAVQPLTELARRTRSGRVAVESWDGRPVIGSDGEALLVAAGFSRGPRRMAYRAPLR